MVPAPSSSPSIDTIIERIGIPTTEHWVNLLRTLSRHEVGVVKASGKLLVDPYLGQLATELTYLARETGFCLPLIIGGGVQYDALPAHHEAGRVNDLRITSAELIEQMLPLAWENQERVAAALRIAGVDAVVIPPETVRVKKHGTEYDRGTHEEIDLGFVGDVVTIDTKRILAAIYAGQIPIVSHLGLCSQDGKIYNVNATTLAAELVRVLGAKKLIIVGDQPVKDGDAVVRTFFSRRVFEEMCMQGTISGGMAKNVREAFDLLERLGPDHSVQLTTLKYANGEGGDLASTGLLEELLGDGSGTKVMTPSPVVAYPLSAIDIVLVTRMINDAFMMQQQKRLVPGYFPALTGKDPTVYLDANKRGGAVTYPLPGFNGKGCEYLCKLATRPDYEGLGVAASIMEMIILQKGAVAWRSSQPSRLYDSVIRHYGGFKEEPGNYTVYGVGIPDDKKEDVILRVVSIPVTLQKMEGTP